MDSGFEKQYFEMENGSRIPNQLGAWRPFFFVIPDPLCGVSLNTSCPEEGFGILGWLGVGVGKVKD